MSCDEPRVRQDLREPLADTDRADRVAVSPHEERRLADRPDPVGEIDAVLAALTPDDERGRLSLVRALLAVGRIEQAGEQIVKMLPGP